LNYALARLLTVVDQPKEIPVVDAPAQLQHRELARRELDRRA
jgi:hypothetical protein